MCEMDRWKCVEAIMRSKLFRDQLERGVRFSLKNAAVALVSQSLRAARLTSNFDFNSKG